MDSREAQKQDFNNYLVPISNDQDHIFLRDRADPEPYDIHNTRHETLEQLHVQRPKRIRSNSDEDSDNSITEAFALLSKASLDDVRRVLSFLKGDAKGPSPNISSTISSTTPPTENVNSVTASELFLGAQNQVFQPAPLDSTLWYDNTMGSQDWMQPISSTSESSYGLPADPDFSFQCFLEYGPARASMPIQGTPHHNPTPRSHVSQPVPSRGATAPSYAAYMLQEEMTANPQDLHRDSISSASSHGSDDTFLTRLGGSSGYSTPASASSLWYSQSSNALPRRPPSQRTMSSSLSSKRIQNPVSALECDGNTSLGARVPCSYATCTTTFSRDADRIRHESSKHTTDGGYICLFHTCSSSCPDRCMNEQHKQLPYRHVRADKMKEHLNRVHNWILKQKEIPKAFAKNLAHGPRGWTCGCGIFLGNWHEDERSIVAHVGACNGEVELEVGFKRLSFDDPLALREESVRSRRSELSIDKALPPTPFEY